MDTPTPEEERRLELHATIVETIARIRNPTESDVRRVLQELRTGDPELDREIDEHTDVLILLALNKSCLLYGPPPRRGPIDDLDQ